MSSRQGHLDILQATKRCPCVTGIHRMKCRSPQILTRHLICANLWKKTVSPPPIQGLLAKRRDLATIRAASIAVWAHVVQTMGLSPARRKREACSMAKVVNTDVQTCPTFTGASCHMLIHVYQQIRSSQRSPEINAPLSSLFGGFQENSKEKYNFGGSPKNETPNCSCKVPERATDPPTNQTGQSTFQPIIQPNLPHSSSGSPVLGTDFERKRWLRCSLK